MTPKNYLILDARGLLLKRYHGANGEKLFEADGKTRVPCWEPGLTNFIERDLSTFLRAYPARNVIAVWDSGNDYRRALFPGYKEKRRAKEMGDVLKTQHKELVDTAQTLFAYSGITNVYVPGQEADDLIALLCSRLEAQSIVVRTVDADLLQLVDERVSVMLEDEIFQPGTEHKGVPVELVRLYKSMVGDSTDEYLGVPDLGDKTFKNLLTKYGKDGMEQLEDCVRSGNLDALRSAFSATQDPALGMLLEKHSEWSLGYQLASLHPECCFSAHYSTGIVKPTWHARIPNRDRVFKALFNAKCPDLIVHFEHLFPEEILVTADNYQELQGLVEEALRTSDEIPFDYESYDTLKHEPFQIAAKSLKTRYVDVLSQSVTGMSFNFGRNREKTVYVSINHADTNNLPKAWLIWVLQRLDTKPLIAHNAMFEYTVTRCDLDIDIQAPLDTKIMSSYANEELLSGLKSLAMDWLHYKMTTYQEVVGERDMSQISAAEVLSYGCDDSLVTGRLYDLFSLILQTEGSFSFYLENEIEHMKDSSENFIHGTKISLDTLTTLYQEDKETIIAKSDELRSLLAANATTKDYDTRVAHASKLLEIEWEIAAFKHAGKTQVEIQAAYQEIFKKCWFSCLYEPYVVETLGSEFKATPKKLTEVLMLLDRGSDLPPIDKNSKRGIRDWVQRNEELLEASTELMEFGRLLSAASASLSKVSDRHGADYDALVSFGQEILNARGATKTEGHGTELNFGSPDQMQNLFYGIMGLPVRRRSKVNRGSFRDKHKLPGNASTSNKAIAAALVYDIAETGDWRREALLALKEIKTAQQNISLYHKPYPLWEHPRDGLLHPQIINCGTKTRRPTGSAPNVLQVSKKDDARIRKVYKVYNDEYAYVCLDFNGQELRIAGSESEDPALLDAYLGEVRKDPHSLTGSGVAHILLPREGLPQYASGVTYEQFLQGRAAEATHSAFDQVRNIAKAINFLIIYVGGYTTLAENLIIPAELGKELMRATFRTYPGLRPWQDQVIEFARAHGYVETAYGNRRHLTRDILSVDDGLRTRQERQAVNYTIQGCAADILKLVLTEMRSKRMMSRYHLRSVMPIYDEIASCVPVQAIPEYIQEMREIMEITPPGHRIPMQIEAAIGFDSWGGKVELKDTSYTAVVEFLKQQKEAA